jgi:hypothetical protein
MKELNFNLQAPWEEIKEKLKEVNVELTDEDLRYEPGKEAELIDRLSKKMRKDAKQVKDFIEGVASTKSIAR